jgi:hypothetical protein
MRGTWFFIAAMLVAAGARAGELEAGVRYWLNTGSTKRSHDASSFDPSVLNPTSTLTYSGLDSNAFELYVRKRFGERSLVKGNLGLGRVNTGTFTDQDFFIDAGVPVMTQTVSPVSGKLNHVTLDVGQDVWLSGNTTVAIFFGYQQWNERLDGHGFQDSFGPASLPASVLAITNDLTWKSFRLGAEMRSVRGRTRFTLEGALVPYAKYRNEDSHHLRQDPSDLGPVPNVIATGHGWGGQFEAEVRRSYPEAWGLDFGIGYRYWLLDSKKGAQQQAGLEFPLVELRSRRHGLLFSVSKAW